MNIIGIGTDIVNIERIEKSISGKARDKFIARIFTNYEQDQIKGKANEAAFFAKRFAAKEALVKALGTGIRGGIFWTDIEVRNNDLGKPELFLSGEAHKTASQKMPAGQKYQLALSLSDDHPFAIAFVIISSE
jgi:holo-[acyl-carrier protein] synthase